MPYIDVRRRVQIKTVDRTKGPVVDHPNTVGELVYVLWKECAAYINGHPLGSTSYRARIEIYGAIMGLGAEWYRRRVAGYEDEKIREHGDVLS